MKMDEYLKQQEAAENQEAETKAMQRAARLLKVARKMVGDRDAPSVALSASVLLLASEVKRGIKVYVIPD